MHPSLLLSQCVLYQPFHAGQADNGQTDKETLNCDFLVGDGFHIDGLDVRVSLLEIADQSFNNHEPVASQVDHQAGGLVSHL